MLLNVEIIIAYRKNSNRIESNEFVKLVNEIAKFSLLILSNNLCITYIFFHFLFFFFL